MVDKWAWCYRLKTCRPLNKQPVFFMGHFLGSESVLSRLEDWKASSKRQKKSSYDFSVLCRHSTVRGRGLPQTHILSLHKTLCPIEASKNGAKGQSSKHQKVRAEYSSFFVRWRNRDILDLNEKSRKSLHEEERQIRSEMNLNKTSNIPWPKLIPFLYLPHFYIIWCRKIIWQSPTSILDKNSQKIRNREEFSQFDIYVN